MNSAKNKMDIRQKILEIRSAQDRSTFGVYFANRPEEFQELLACFFNLDEYPYKEYASWMLIHISQSKRIDLQSYYPQFVDLLFKTNDQTVLRNITRTLHDFTVTNYRESEFIDLLIGFVQDHNNKVALHVYSIYLLAQFVRHYPELKAEISEVIALHRVGKSAAYFSSERNFHKLTKSI